MFVSRCFIDIKDFIKPSKNISEELETTIIEPYLKPEPDPKTALSMELRVCATSASTIEILTIALFLQRTRLLETRPPRDIFCGALMG